MSVNKGRELLKAVQTIMEGFNASRNHPACISAAGHRYDRVWEGIEMYRQARQSMDDSGLKDRFLFIENAPAQDGFMEKVQALKKEIKEKYPESTRDKSEDGLI